MASSSRIGTTPVDDDLMYFAAWIISSYVAELRVTARARVSPECQSLAVPQLMLDFSRRTFPLPEHPAEHVDSSLGEPFRLSMQDSAWEVVAQSAFMQATADFLPPDDGELIAPAFSRYISSVFDRLPIRDVVLLEISSIILVTNEFYPIDQLRLALPGEEFSLLHAYDSEYSDDSDIDDADSGGQPRPASAAAVEGLKSVSVMEEGSCSICLKDFEVEAPVLTMPCSHAFHEKCLKKWLDRSSSCPLCRFLLPEAE